MKLEFNREQLLELMRDFYTLSGIRIVLFDDEYHELLSYPEKPCRFCQMMKDNEVTQKLCNASDAQSFRQAEREKKLIIYHCHAGLIEATIPLEDNHVTIGYLMFGQISNHRTAQELHTALQAHLTKYSILPPSDIWEGIPIKSHQQIQAAAKIMEACTHYALLSQAVGLKRLAFSRQLHAYLLAHLHEPLNSQKIAEGLQISRSKLYEQCSQFLGMGIGEYLKKLRIEQAQTLLRNTGLSMAQVAEQVGFSDYNYFCRVFKKETGMSTRQIRKQPREK